MEPTKPRTGRRRITMKDIARLSNCSPTTVSFILNDHPQARSIPESTKLRVYAAVADLDYVPNAYAKMLRAGNPRTIGVISFDMTDPYCIDVLRGIGQRLNEQNFFYQLADVQNDVNHLRAFLQAARGRNIEGIIGIVNSLAIEPATLAEFFGNKSTFISIGRIIPGLNTSSIILDNELGGRLAVEHLHALGHRELAFILGPRAISDSQLRWRGIQQACAELGLAVRPELVEELDSPADSAEVGAQAVRAIQARGVPFTGLVAFDDITAYGAIWELTRAGLSVPGDISVIGFDDIWPSKAFNPPLTTIRQPMEEMGARGAELIVDLLEHADGPRGPASEVVLEPSLIVRHTTAPPSTRPRRTAARKPRSVPRA